MTTGAWLFMLSSWIFVLGLTFWSFWRILRSQQHFDPDGIGPASPPVPARTGQETTPAGR